MTLCGANIGGVARFDGELVHMVALSRRVARGDATLMQQAFPMTPRRGAVPARAVLERAPVQIRRRARAIRTTR